MEKTYEIKLPNGEVVTKSCYVANQGSTYNAIPIKYLSNLRYVNDKGEVKALVGTLTHTVFWEDIKTLITGFEFRFHDNTVIKERSVVFVIVNEKETYAIGTANFVLNFLTKKKGEFLIQRKDGDFSFYTDVDVIYEDINLGPLHGVTGLIAANKDLSVASSLYEVIREKLSQISTDIGLQCAYLEDVDCTPLDSTTMSILMPFVEGRTVRTEVGKMVVVEMPDTATEGTMLFFDGVKWYHYTRGEQLFRRLLRTQRRLLNIARGSQFGEIS